MTGKKEVPKTILEEIIDETLLKLKEDSEFNEKIIEKLESTLKDDNTDSNDIIEIIKESIN